MGSINFNLVKASIIVVLILSFIGIHYGVTLLSIEQYIELRKIELSILVCIGIFGGLMMLFHKKRSRSRNIFASIMLMCGLAAAITLVAFLLNSTGIVVKRCISPGVLSYGNFFAFLFSLYPIDVMRPGWLTLKRTSLLFLPAFLLSIVCVLYVMSGGSLNRVSSLAQAFQVLSPLDLTCRFLMLGYPIYSMILLLKYRKEYNSWVENNYTTIPSISIEWLDYYIVGYFIILISYLYLITVGSIQSTLAHGFIFITFFSGLYGKVLFHSNPYSENQFISDKEVPDENNIIKSNTSKDNYRFEDKIDYYKELLDNWFKTEKPYLRNDFKLIDIAELLPLNRTYLSRLLNEGYQKNFNSLITSLRVEESIRLMNEDSNYTMSQISDITGFSSPSVFGRSFLREKGISPKQYFNEVKIINIQNEKFDEELI